MFKRAKHRRDSTSDTWREGRWDDLRGVQTSRTDDHLDCNTLNYNRIINPSWLDLKHFPRPLAHCPVNASSLFVYCSPGEDLGETWVKESSVISQAQRTKLFCCR